MKPGEYRLKNQNNSPFLAVDYLEWSSQKGEWVRKIKSTKKSDLSEAHKFAAATAETARKVQQMTETGWSKAKAMELVNDILKAAGLPTVKPVQSWAVFSRAWLALKKQKRSPKTAVKYEHAIDGFDAVLGSRVKLGIDTVTQEDCQQFHDVLSEKGNLPVTINFDLQVLRAIFKQAMARGECTTNPAMAVNLSEDTAPRLIREIYTVAEIKKILKAAQKREETREWMTMLLIGICTGARIGDAAAMMWSHIEKAGTTWSFKYLPAKTKRKGKYVVVPIVEPLLSHLKKLEKEKEGLYICPNLASVRHLSREFGKLLDVAGVKQGNIGKRVKSAGKAWRTKSFHSLRHTLPSWLQAAGVDIETRMAIVGHSDKDIHKGYTHIELKATAAALDGALGKLVS